MNFILNQKYTDGNTPIRPEQAEQLIPRISTSGYRKLLALKKWSGRMDLPSTSWSRTTEAQILNALSGVTSGTKSIVSPLFVVTNLSPVHTPGSNCNHTWDCVK